MPAILNSVQRMFEGLSLGTTTGKALIAAGSILTAFFSPIVVLLVACFAFTVVDMIYGIKVANKQKQKITSDKNWKGTLTKIVDEFAIITLARLLEFAVLGDTGVFVLTGGSTMILCLTEMWSILENLNTLNTNGPWRALGKFLKQKGEEYTKIKIDTDGSDSDNI